MSDFLMNEEGDLDFLNGDFRLGAAEEQHIDHLLTAKKGEYKEFPLVGAAVAQLLKAGNANLRIRSEVVEQLEWDGYDVRQISIDSSKIYIDAIRKNGNAA